MEEVEYRVHLLPCPNPKCLSPKVEWRGPLYKGQVTCYACGMEGPEKCYDRGTKDWNELARPVQMSPYLPKVPGWYFYRDKDTDFYGGKPPVMYLAEAQIRRLQYKKGEEWGGPIPMPLSASPHIHEFLTGLYAPSDDNPESNL